MPEYPNSGILFPNFRKAAANHPDYRGTCTVDGKKKVVSAWKRAGTKGEFLTLAFKDDVPKDAPAAAPPQPGETTQPPKEGGIPF